MVPTSSTVPALIALGLTGIEAEIYVALLLESPATGYAVAKAIGKPVANVYKGIQTLQEKGFVAVDEGDTRLCRPIPAEDLLRRLERDFRARRDQAREALADLPGPAMDTRVYQMRSSDQVFDRAREMIASASQVVLVDVFPEPLEILRSDLQEAAARGVLVAAKLYQPREIEGVETIVDPRGEVILERWPGQWLNVVIDGAQLMLALVHSGDARVVQSIHSGSPYLSWVLHSSMACELGYALLARGIESGEDAATLRHTLERTLRYFAPDAPGYRLLVDSLAPSRAGRASMFHEEERR